MMEPYKYDRNPTQEGLAKLEKAWDALSLAAEPTLLDAEQIQEQIQIARVSIREAEAYYKGP